MFFIIFFSIRRQNFINSVSRATTILARCNIGNDLRDLRSRSLNRLWTFDFSISNLKAICQHALKINQTAIRHRCIRTVIQIVIVDVSFLMCICHMWWQHLQTNRFPNNSRRQITLGVENIAIFIGVFIDNCLVFVKQFSDCKVNICCF